MTRRLEGKVGAAIARALADEGATVVVNYASSREGAERVLADIAQRGGTAIAVQGDVSNPAHIERLFSQTARPSAASTSWSTTPGSTSSRRSST